MILPPLVFPGVTLWQALALLVKIKFAGVEHASLFRPVVSDKERNVYGVETKGFPCCGQCYKTFYSRKLRLFVKS